MKAPRGFILVLLAVLVLNVSADMGPYDRVEINSISLSSWLVYFFAVMILVALYYKDRNPFYLMGWVPMILLFLLVAFFLWNLGDYLSFLWVFGGLGAFLGTLMPKKIKERILIRQKKTLNTALLVALIILSQVVILGTSVVVYNKFSPVVTKNWEKFQPLAPTIAYYAGSQNFVVYFNNVVGVPIEINSFSAYERLSGTYCVTDAVIGERSFSNCTEKSCSQVGEDEKIPPGNAFGFSVKCKDAGKKTGDQYDLELSMEYNSILQSIKTEHIEDGSIKGTVD